MNNEYVIFDLDGTLIDSWESITLCLTRTVEAVGCESVPSSFFSDYDISHIGKAFHQCHDRFVKEMGWREFKSLSDKIYIRDCLDKVKTLEPGVMMLNQTLEKGMDCVVLTNKFQMAADIICTMLFGPTTFKHIIGRKGIRMIKPYKYAINAITRCGLDIACCAGYVGDSETDRIMAEKMGVRYHSINELSSTISLYQ